MLMLIPVILIGCYYRSFLNFTNVSDIAEMDKQNAIGRAGPWLNPAALALPKCSCYNYLTDRAVERSRMKDGTGATAECQRNNRNVDKWRQEVGQGEQLASIIDV